MKQTASDCPLDVHYREACCGLWPDAPLHLGRHWHHHRRRLAQWRPDCPRMGTVVRSDRVHRNCSQSWWDGIDVSTCVKAKGLRFADRFENSCGRGAISLDWALCSAYHDSRFLELDSRWVCAPRNVPHENGAKSWQDGWRWAHPGPVR